MRTPLYKLGDDELRAIERGEQDADYGSDAARARSTARTLLVARGLQRRAGQVGVEGPTRLGTQGATRLGTDGATDGEVSR